MTTGPDELATDRWAVIGAGPHGLAAVKALAEHGIAVTGYEREPDVGGNWNSAGRSSRVYGSTHLISSKPFTAYPDFPMPDDYPDYPHHRQVMAYFQRYADHFGLRPLIRFGTEVERVSPVDGGRCWDVTSRDASGRTTTTRYAGVVVANGHNWNPKLPEYPGLDAFAAAGGTVLHSAGYKGPDAVRDRRVLVVGAGNTGCDLAVESAQNAVATYHSTRRGYYYNPKYLNGKPADQVNDTLLMLRVPLPVRRALYHLTTKVVVGDYTRFGLRPPDHKFYETHPIVNSLLVYYVGQGDIVPRPDVERFEGRSAVFADGTRTDDLDVVLFCTGYLVRFDFLDGEHLNWQGDHPRLYLHMFTPQHDNLFVSGLIQPDSGQWCIAHWQGQAIARAIRARSDDPRVHDGLRREVAARADDRWTGGTQYADSTRHYYEISHQDYLVELERLLARLDGVAA